MPAPRKVSPRQLELLLEFAENQPDIALGRFKGPLSSQAARQASASLASKLNCVAEGTIKTPDQWRRYWIEFKARTKNKAADCRRNALSTGGGPNKYTPFTSIEEKVLAIISRVAVEGLPEVQIPICILTEEVAPPNAISAVQYSPSSSVLPIDLEGQNPMPSPVPSLPLSLPPPSPPPSFTRREEARHSRKSPQTRLSNPRRLRTSRPIRQDRNVPQWAYNLEIRKIEVENRRTEVAAEQLKIQREIASGVTGIKLALQELISLLKEHVTK